MGRDLYRYTTATRLYEYLFLQGTVGRPGQVSKAGAFSTAASKDPCSYEGQVQYLEACNMSFRRTPLLEIGGFDDHAFRGVGEFSEPDACLRLTALVGGKLLFTQQAALLHCPSTDGAYNLRLDTATRLSNYMEFSARWVLPSLQHSAYKLFLRSYYRWKQQAH